MDKSQITIPNRPKPHLGEASDSYYGTLKEFRSIVVRFWESRSYMYNDACLLCSIFPEHILASANNGFMNEFHIRNIKECYEYFYVWNRMEFYIRNWKYCEYYIGSDSVYHNELDCYIRNILKGVTFPDIETLNPDTELKNHRGKWVHEKLLFNIITSIFSKYTVQFHYREKWLEKLELDIFIEELAIGIEYQGIQHYQVIKHWDGEDGLKKRQANDAKKRKLCKENGITLIYFNYTEPINNSYVRKKLKKFLN